jgi:hypothetical protein
MGNKIASLDAVAALRPAPVPVGQLGGVHSGCNGGPGHHLFGSTGQIGARQDVHIGKKKGKTFSGASE